MANTQIQLFRTAVAGRTPNVTSSGNSQYINVGQLAMNFTDQILYSTNGTALFVIGANVPNQSITNTFTIGNSTVNTTMNTTVLAFTTGVSIKDSTGALGTAGQVLTTNGSGNLYWSTPPGGSGGSVNTANQYIFSNTITFSNNIVIGNSTVNTSVNSTAIAGTGGNTVVLANGFQSIFDTLGNLTLPTALKIGTINSTANGLFTNNVLLQLGNTSVYSNIIPGSILTTSNLVTTNIYATLLNANVAGLRVSVGNSTINTVINTTTIAISTGVNIQDSTGAIGTAGQVLTTNGSGNLYWSTVSGGGGSINTANQYVFSNTITFSNNITVGNSTVYVSTNATTISGSSGNTTVTANGFVTTFDTLGNLRVPTAILLGTINTTSNGASLTSTLLQIGNSSVYSNVGPGTIITTSNVVTVNVYATTVTANLTGNVSATVVNSTTITATGVTNTANLNVTTNNMTLGTSNVSGNGFIHLPGGVMLNWGWVSSNSTVGTATFSNAFPTNAYVVIAEANTPVATYQPGVTAWTKTSATILTSNATATNVYYVAIGH